MALEQIQDHAHQQSPSSRKLAQIFLAGTEAATAQTFAGFSGANEVHGLFTDNQSATKIPVQQESKPKQEQPSLAETGPYVDATAIPLFKGAIASLVGHISSLMQMEAKRQSIHVMNITIYGHISPEDGSQKLVLTQVAHLAAKPTFEYRRRVFKVVASWMKTLPPEQMILVRDNIVVNISWDSASIAT